MGFCFAKNSGRNPTERLKLVHCMTFVAATFLSWRMSSRNSEAGSTLVTNAGVATRMFNALAAENINIQMISTSEIKISVVIAERYLEVAVRSIHKVFDLGNNETAE